MLTPINCRQIQPNPTQPNPTPYNMHESYLHGAPRALTTVGAGPRSMHHIHGQFLHIGDIVAEKHVVNDSIVPSLISEL
jgi:hypothetical protein